MTKDDYTVVKLADFGLAKDADASTMKTFCGTPAYMAPEMVDNEKLAYNPRIDMRKAGVTSGRLIFHHQWKYVTLETQHAIKMMLKPTLRVSAKDALRKSWLQNSEVVSKAKAIVAKFIQTKKDPEHALD
ncbi:unnamed protein product [Strongylus vulgaris]|uniref:Protein kinase domain-containing protein n=1 Tax=Strongylus vulgaris TaxID=40348 RepID=A0A3P7IUU9_STRVU|nr:unnamed protein product [Strongylus vulgaris]